MYRESEVFNVHRVTCPNIPFASKELINTILWPSFALRKTAMKLGFSRILLVWCVWCTCLIPWAAHTPSRQSISLDDLIKDLAYVIMLSYYQRTKLAMTNCLRWGKSTRWSRTVDSTQISRNLHIVQEKPPLDEGARPCGDQHTRRERNIVIVPPRWHKEFPSGDRLLSVNRALVPLGLFWENKPLLLTTTSCVY